MTAYFYLASLALAFFYAAVSLRRELQMLQQNSYRPERYWRGWLRANLLSSQRITDLMLAGVAAAAGGLWTLGVYVVMAVGLVAMFKAIRLLSTKSKKPLVFTPRATRIYTLSLVGIALPVAFVALCVTLMWFGILFWGWPVSLTLTLAACSPLVLLVALWLLSPVERAINRWYVDDARRILRQMPGLVVIGITGSYGKTSTKHYLHRILSERFSVVMTPGSFNTTLGVVRTIREHLKPYTDVFIVEMGAKQAGDIKEICELVNPRIGIVTAVGEQHLESFKSIENVQRTKFELIDSLPPDGTAILNDDFEMVASREVTGVKNVLRYSTKNAAADFYVSDISYGRGETTFAINGAAFSTRLVGVHNLSNIAAGYIAGRELGLTEGEMRHAIGSIEQVEHRLSIRTTGGVTVIDDAFNSNPHGAAMALDVLAGFTGGRRIVVTPGMIELGAKQESYNRAFGEQIAQSADVAVVVGEYNRDAIVEGLGNFAEIYLARDFADASAYVRSILRAGDVVLYENDLPDTFK